MAYLTNMSCIDFTFDKARSECYQPSPVSPVRFEKLPNGGYKYNNDVRLLFNQERLRKLLGADSLTAWLGTMDNNYRKSVDTTKLPDHVVLDFVKSRNIQSPSELLQWSEYLNSCAQELVDKYNAEQAELAAAQAAEQAAAQAAQSPQPAPSTEQSLILGVEIPRP